MNTQDLKNAIRSGPYAWPGGYPLLFVADDGEPICFDCVKKELRQVLAATKAHAGNGWEIIAVDINWEDTNCACVHCNKQIESAYGED